MKAHKEQALLIQEQWIRAVVKEEIIKVLGALAREADHQNIPYETDCADSNVYNLIGRVAEGTVGRLTCEHEYRFDKDRCWTCGELRPELTDPFKEEGSGS